ncbi:glycosyl transferase family protein [Marimonas lutisalis]|uniref:glycosyl transferase family protein n=1 Tax=Marimonas lutisalis TaxID=2545756 RepID=UPI0010F9DCE0|nr:glycosyl transferase family protein [Marimonas lutisalis]
MNAQQPHPFSKFVAILGRGKTKQRHLTLDESVEAMEMLLRDEAVPEQIGAFLMLLRLKEEAPEEIAGFALGTRKTFDLPADMPHVDIDWSSYAGKRIQLPWFVLSVMALVNAGYSVCMHGTEGHTPGRVYTRGVLEELGFPAARTLAEAADQIRARRFAYVPLEVMSPTLRHLINLRPIFGLRSPVHSFSRMLNPFDAPTVMQGIFHRGFMDIHSGAAQHLGIPNMAVFRGEGGEIERRPNKPTQVWTTHGKDAPIVEEWPQLLPEGHQPPDEEMDTARLLQVWRGEIEDTYAEATITGTIAVTLRTMGKAGSIAEAEEMGRAVWAARDRDFLPAKA